MNKIVVTTYYPADDEEFIGDYSRIELRISLERDGKRVEYVFHFGDSYHDKGQEKVEGAMEVLQIFGPFEVVEKKDHERT